MLKGKRKIIYLAASTMIVLTGIFTVGKGYERLPDKIKAAEEIPYVQYIKNAVDVFSSYENDHGIFNLLFTDN